MTSSLFYINTLILITHNLFISPFTFFLNIICRAKPCLLWRKVNLSMLPPLELYFCHSGHCARGELTEQSPQPFSHFWCCPKEIGHEKPRLDVTPVSAVTTFQEPHNYTCSPATFYIHCQVDFLFLSLFAPSGEARAPVQDSTAPKHRHIRWCCPCSRDQREIVLAQHNGVLCQPEVLCRCRDEEHGRETRME